ncbi:MAG: hypothetical protein COB83_05820 [Gammaproteobacteria bacterium]|nr:MAG: hypothetical protein COB83_05820 [Gammaproteobacteria bacterium]
MKSSIQKKHAQNKALANFFDYDAPSFYLEVNGHPLKNIQVDIKSVFRHQLVNNTDIADILVDILRGTLCDIEIASWLYNTLELVLPRYISNVSILRYRIVNISSSGNIIVYADFSSSVMSGSVELTIKGSTASLFNGSKYISIDDTIEKYIFSSDFIVKFVNINY